MNEYNQRFDLFDPLEIWSLISVQTTLLTQGLWSKFIFIDFIFNNIQLDSLIHISVSKVTFLTEKDNGN